MNLFVNTISLNACLILFNNNRDIISSDSWKAKGNESSTLIPHINSFLKENKLNYKDIENIITVNGPGSFTGIRTTVLAVNAINYITNKNLTHLSYFDLFTNYPIIKPSSKRDFFLKINSNSKIQIIANEELKNLINENNINTIYGESSTNLFEGVKILEKIDYKSIIMKIKLDNLKQINALYIKKPNIS